MRLRVIINVHMHSSTELLNAMYEYVTNVLLQELTGS